MEIRIPNKPENLLKAHGMKMLSQDTKLEIEIDGDWIIIKESGSYKKEKNNYSNLKKENRWAEDEKNS